MVNKLYEMISESDEKKISLYDKNVVVEEKFGESKNIVKKYHIDTIFIENDDILVRYYLLEDMYFPHTSYIKDLPKTFISQMLNV